MSIFSAASTKLNLPRSAMIVASVVTGSLLVSTPASAATLRNECDNWNSSEFCSRNIDFLSGGLAWYALAAAVVGIFVSASLWALGSKGQNPGQELTGKRGLIVCLAAAFCVGGAVPMMNKIQEYANDLDSAPASAPADPAQNGCIIRQDCAPSGGGTASGLNR